MILNWILNQKKLIFSFYYEDISGMILKFE